MRNLRAPIKTLEVDLACGAPEDVGGLGGYLFASVLVLGGCVPIGTVTVPLRNGMMLGRELSRLIAEHLGSAVARFAVGRALLETGLPKRVSGAIVGGKAIVDTCELPCTTVAVCSRDRPNDLALCLEALVRLDHPSFEILVVDNAPSSDASREMVEARFPSVRYVREDKPGLDNARNRAIGEARGVIVAYTDDDVVVSRGWLRALTKVFAEDPSVAAVSGLVVPYELETESQVLFERYGGFGRGCVRRYVRCPRGGPVPWPLLGAGQLGTGANMAFRRTLFTEVGRFDPALDVGTRTNGGGDLDMFMRALKSGHGFVYEPAAYVRHRHRRSLEVLKRQMNDHGCGLRSYLERVASNFPEERAGVKRLIRWWWRDWAIKRWWRSRWRPSFFPRDFIAAEIFGFWKGKGVYRTVRAASGVDEAQRTDRWTILLSDAPVVPTKRVVRVDVSAPLVDLVEGAEAEEVMLVLEWHGKPVGQLTIETLRSVVPRARLASEIAHTCWTSLLAPGSNLAADFGWFRFFSDVVTSLGAGCAAPVRLADSVSASIVIATRDRPDDLARCLDSIARVETRRSLEIVVVDNNPSSGLTAPVVAKHPGVIFVEEVRPGLSYARNAGIAVARGAIIVCTDDDVTVPPSWVEELLAPFARPDVLGVTGNVLPAKLETEAERRFEEYGGLGRGPVGREFGPDWFHGYRRRAVPTWEIGATANAAFRAEVFERADMGAMDEALGAGSPTGCSEDTLVFYRILLAEGTIVYEPRSMVWHHHRATDRALKKQLYSYSKGHVAYHLRTWLSHRDGRALSRLCAELPLMFWKRIWWKLGGHYSYPWRMMFTEMAGTLAGPWALWQAVRRARRLGPGARRVGDRGSVR